MCKCLCCLGDLAQYLIVDMTTYYMLANHKSIVVIVIHCLGLSGLSLRHLDSVLFMFLVAHYVLAKSNMSDTSMVKVTDGEPENYKIFQFICPE
jgi:hypothetical protein